MYTQTTRTLPTKEVLVPGNPEVITQICIKKNQNLFQRNEWSHK